MLTRYRLTAAALTAVVAISMTGGSANAVLRQVALGVSVHENQSVEALDAERDAIGRDPAIWSVWSDWGGPDKDFPTAFMTTLKERGIVPMVVWQPTAPGSSDCKKWSLDNIINGDYDDYIHQWAEDAKAYGGRVILRFAHEMNGYWFIWGYGRCENTPKKFRLAWQHVFNIFRGPDGVGATNVKFLWSIFGDVRLKPHYPGNKYVDYVGLSAFNWGDSKRPWRSMVKVMAGPMRGLMGLTRKPIIAAETGVATLPDCATCDKVAWVRDGYPAVYAKWPRIKAIVYFDLDMRFANQPNWLLSEPEGALSAYRDIAVDPRFMGKLP